MKFKSQIVTQASGSIGGTTYSRNRGGMYMRARAVPTNPSSPAQVLSRQAFSDAAKEWKDLPEAVRQQWEAYALTVPRQDTLGSTFFLTGQQMYCRCRTPRIYVGSPALAAAPITAGLPPYTTPTLSAQLSVDLGLKVSIDVNDNWVNTDDGFMSIQVSDVQEQTINYFKGPFTLAGVIFGSTAGPAPDSFTVAPTAGWAPGKQLFARMNIEDGEGRLADPIILSATISA